MSENHPEEHWIELETPGEMLRQDFLEPMGLTPDRLAKGTGVPATRISEILHGKRAITAETSLLLDKYFGLSDGYWFRLQADFDLRRARRAMGERLSRVEPFQASIPLGEAT